MKAASPKPTLAALLDNPVPPAFPSELRRRLGMGSAPAADSSDSQPQLTQAQELDKMFPTQTSVVVHRLVRIDEEGRKHREPMTIYLEEATIEECAAIARPINKVAGDIGKGIPTRQLVEENHLEAIEAIHAATRVDKEVLRNLMLTDITALAEAVFQVNAGFFVRRIPLLLAKVRGMVEHVIGRSQTSSAPSTATASTSLNS